MMNNSNHKAKAIVVNTKRYGLKRNQSVAYRKDDIFIFVIYFYEQLSLLSRNVEI